MEIFDPVGIVQAVFAAFDEVGRVTRSLLDCSLGSSLEFNRGPDELAVAGGLETDDDEVLAVFSSPN